MNIDYEIRKAHIYYMWIFTKKKKTLNKIIEQLNITNYEFKKTTRKGLKSCYAIKMQDSLGHIFDKYKFFLENN